MEYQFTKIESVNNDNLSDFKFEGVYTPYGKFSLTASINEHCSYKQLSAYDESLLSSQLLIPDYDPAEDSSLNNNTKTRPITIKRGSNPISNTPENFSPPFSTVPVVIPNMSSYKAFSSTPPFSSQINTQDSSSKSPRSRAPSLKLNVSPFKDSSTNLQEQPYKMKMNVPITPLYSVPAQELSSKYSIPSQESIFVENSDSPRDLDSEVGFFVEKCQASPHLLMFDVPPFQLKTNYSEILSDLEHFEQGLE